MGVCVDLWLSFQGYLIGRQQCVSLGSNCSKLLPVISGVPQDSISGLLLFLVYITDLPAFPFTSHLLLYANDAKCETHHECSRLPTTTSGPRKCV